MKKIKIFIELIRLNKPIGYMLLFWPCLWGLTLAYSQNLNFDKYLIYILYFFLGSVLMRSAGCIVNDIVDKDIDRKVKRTKKRPLASNKISLNESYFYVIVLCLVAFSILIQLNNLTIILGILSMSLAFTYPFMKRYTYWPQLFLGITFNWGIIMAGSSILNTVSIDFILLYMAAIFWTLGYDTIYGYQDIEDDEIIGIKSTSIKFKKGPKKFIFTCYLISICFFLILGLINNIGTNYFILLIVPIIQMMYQIKNLNIKNHSSCLTTFKSNNFFGLLIFLTLLISLVVL